MTSSHFSSCLGVEWRQTPCAPSHTIGAGSLTPPSLSKLFATEVLCGQRRTFFREKRWCIDNNCGGFAWRKPHMDQFGQEDEPPVCFFFRRSQAELRKSFKASTKYDFFLAPADFHPDCSFRPGREPAPACHVWWQAGERVHAFACQVSVTEAAPGTYYMVCGFDCGYCGIQQLQDGRQMVLFSVWNHPEGRSRVQGLSAGEGVVLEPFGGEGMGLKASSITPTPLACWTPGETYTFLVRAKATAAHGKVSPTECRSRSGHFLSPVASP